MASVFTPAHAVVIDCALFLAAQVMADDRTPLVWDQLTRALPGAAPIGDVEIDRLVTAATGFLAARNPVQSVAHATAAWALRDAATHYAWARLTKSAAALSATPKQRPAP